MSQIILIFVKLNNKQRFINGLTHCNEPVAGGASRVVVFFISQKNCFSKPKLALAGPDDSSQPHWVFRLNLFMTVIKLQLWPQAARPIFQSKNYKNVGGRFFLLCYEKFSSSWFRVFFLFRAPDRNDLDGSCATDRGLTAKVTRNWAFEPLIWLRQKRNRL